MGLSDNISKLKPVNVIVIGDAMLDRYIFGSVDRISPEAPVPVLKYEREEFFPGGAANVAMKLVQLEADVRLYCVAGEDETCDMLCRLLNEAHIIDVVKAHHTQTTLKTRYVANGHQLLRVDKEDINVDQSWLSGIVNHAQRLTDGWANVVVVSDYGKGVCSRKVLSKVLTTADARDIPVVIDPFGVDYSKYRYSEAVLVPNEKEAAAAVMVGGYKIGAQRILNDTHGSFVAVTRGAQGIEYFYQDGAYGHVPPHPVEVFDVTGAGDAVTAMFAVALASGLDYSQAAALANLAGGIIVTQLGTGHLSKELLMDAARAYEENVNSPVNGEMLADWKLTRENL